MRTLKNTDYLSNFNRANTKNYRKQQEEAMKHGLTGGKGNQEGGGGEYGENWEKIKISSQNAYFEVVLMGNLRENVKS